MKKVTKDTTIADLVRDDPEAADMLRQKGLGCTGCPMAQFETIEMGAAGHGLDPQEIIDEINRKKKEFENS